jgi:hypothetical protein
VNAWSCEISLSSVEEAIFVESKRHAQCRVVEWMNNRRRIQSKPRRPASFCNAEFSFAVLRGYVSEMSPVQCVKTYYVEGAREYHFVAVQEMGIWRKLEGNMLSLKFKDFRPGLLPVVSMMRDWEIISDHFVQSTLKFLLK